MQIQKVDLIIAGFTHALVVKIMLQYQIQDVVVVVNYINVIKPYHIQLFNWVIQAHQATNVLLYNNGLPVQQNTSCAFKMAGGYVWDSKKKIMCKDVDLFLVLKWKNI